MADIPRITPRDGVSAIATHLKGEGCVIVEGLASGDLLERIERELNPILDRVNTNNTEFTGHKTKRFNGILSQVPATLALVEHPSIISTLERVLLPYCVGFQLNYDGIMHLMPGETSQRLHRDGGVYPLRHPAPPYIIACMWAQTEFTRDNGGTCLLPGSHLWDEHRKPSAQEIVQAEMPAGSVVIYTSGIYHGAGANRSNAPRTGIALQYNYAWLRQELNMYLTYPPEVAKTFPDTVQRLIGYDFGGPYLGFVNGGSPQTHLQDDVPQTRERSRPEMDSALERLENIPFGDGLCRIATG